MSSKNKTTPTLQAIPLRMKNHTNMDHLFSVHNFAVAVNYYVLRPQKKNNS